LTRRLVTAGRVPFLVLVLLLTAALGYEAAGIRTEQSNQSMDSPSAEQRAVYDRFRGLFGSDEDLLLSVTHPRLLDVEGIRLLDDVTTRIAALDGVRRVYSLSNARELVPGPDGAAEHRLVPRPLGGRDFAARLAAGVRRNPELEGFLISADAHTAGVVVELADRPGDDAYRARIIDAIRALIATEGGGPATLHLTGIAVQKYDVTQLLERDQAVLIPAAAVLLAVLLVVFFRRPSGVVLPLAVTAVTLIWTLGGYALSGLALNPVTALLPPVIMVLSVSTSVHLYEHWLHGARGLTTSASAIAAAVRALRYPCFFTSLTTALGMLSLLLSDTPAVRHFGAFAALGVMLSFVLSFTLMPVALSLLRPPRDDPRPHGGVLAACLRATARLATRRAGAVLGVATLLTVAALAAIPRIHNNTDLVRFLKPGAALYEDSLYIDRHLAGVNALEFMVARRDGAPLPSLDVVRRLDRFRAALVAEDEVTGVQSLLSILSPLARAETGARGWQLPTTEDDALTAFDLIDAAGDDPLVRRLVDARGTTTRVRAQVHAIGTEAAGRLLDRILIAGRAIFGDAYTLVPTGAFYQVTRGSNRLVRSQVASFALALVLVLLTIGAMFLSVELMLLAAIPNVMPILWTGGLMGVLGIDLSSGTAMIASVVIGLAVDDTIHYLTRFRREQHRGAYRAVCVTTTRTGRALVISSVVLILGFWVGALGSFRPTIYFSLLTGVTMISALLCDLLVLPSLLMVRHARRRAAAT
jgi:uncharacterized protein